MSYSLNAYDFQLPRELIAQYPSHRRDESKLLLYDSTKEEVCHASFSQIPCFLNDGDLLVLNNTKVFPARLHGSRKGGGSFEVLLIKPMGQLEWLCFLKPAKKMKTGLTFVISSSLTFEVVECCDDGYRVIKFNKVVSFEDLEMFGEIPLPPYIERESESDDWERYQTVFASKVGAVASPTAGLHFTKELLQQIRESGVNIAFVTLHVGPGTFKPISSEDIRTHHMEKEFFEVPDETVQLLKEAEEKQTRIIAVGTTTTRVLESIDHDKQIYSGWTNLYIYPPYRFKRVQALITNFHLPRSTLLLLVASFIGYDNMMSLYHEAILKKYRFYSYGDGMFLCPVP